MPRSSALGAVREREKERKKIREGDQEDVQHGIIQFVGIKLKKRKKKSSRCGLIASISYFLGSLRHLTELTLAFYLFSNSHWIQASHKVRLTPFF